MGTISNQETINQVFNVGNSMIDKGEGSETRSSE